MAQGIQIFNDKGEIIFDLNNRTTYVLGTGNTGSGDGSLADSRIRAGSTWVALTSSSGDCIAPRFTATNGKLSWSYTTQTPLYGSKTDRTFIYGVY